MLADDVRLDVVSRDRRRGKPEVGVYFTNYAGRSDWRFASGSVEGRPAAIAFDPADPRRVPTFFVLLDWSDGKVAAIGDFYHARYVVDRAEIAIFD